MNDQTPWLYQGRVGHDVSVGHCSCGGYHSPEEGVEVGTKTLLTKDGLLVWREGETPKLQKVQE